MFKVFNDVYYYVRVSYRQACNLFSLQNGMNKMRNLKTLTRGVTCLCPTGATEHKTSVPQLPLAMTSLTPNAMQSIEL